jgi:3-isopropylmalate/(R)-2-methylmalate dehydratase small subunit
MPSGPSRIALPDEAVAQLQDLAENPATEVSIDLEEQVIQAGDFAVEFDFDPGAKERLVKGLDPIGMTLQEDDAISSYEATRPSWLS